MNDLIRNLNDFVSENFPVDKVTPFLTDYDLKSDVINNEEIKELLDSGAIDDDEFKQMKKEILGK